MLIFAALLKSLSDAFPGARQSATPSSHMDARRISKFLSLVLRHRPEIIQLTLDSAGWASVPVLLEALHARGMEADLETLQRVVADNDKQRFSFSPDFQKIRANQGHSVPVDLQLLSKQPPALLYHGTATKHLESIRLHGLLKGTRQHVHLSHDIDTAREVGKRHGVPVVLVIDAAAMYAEGKDFFQSANGVWLTDAVPAHYILP